MKQRPRVRVQAGSRRVQPASTGTLTEQYRPAYRAADPLDQALGGIQRSRGSADRDWLHNRLSAVAGIRDSVRNDPMAASMVRRRKALEVGWGWIFKPRPDAEALGFNLEDEADEARFDALIDALKREWRRWAEDPLFRCDWESELDFDLMLGLAVRHRIIDGEAVGLVCFREEEDRIGRFKYGTCLHLIDPDRLANPMGRPDSDTLRGGVALEEDGRTAGYHVTRGHPADVSGSFKGLQTDYYPAREPWGRPRVIHLFDKKRAGQHRGVSDLVASLRRLKTLEAYTDAELRSKVINALVVASFSSEMGGDYLAELFGDDKQANALLDLRNQYYETAGIAVGGSKVIQPFPGERLEWNTEGRKADGYADFVFSLAAQVAAGGGGTIEMVTGDFTRHNYSSGRMSLNEAWRDVEVDRALVAKKFATPLAMCVFEEAFYAGRLPLPVNAPDFWDEPGAYVRGEWIGPPRGHVDPVKEPQGGALRAANLSSSLEQIAMEDGNDPDDVIEDNRRFRRRLERRGEVPVSLREILAVSGPTDDPRSEERGTDSRAGAR
ncbi:phage portal protein [Maricaulis maris]|uniref:Lambda family phage portal protein n=1 Tax=Maricaulis maris TaxID=74318 RepID=A0A495D3S1_9PROT|nr:phage portal protein [Maricaulis maris]RKQ95429.1 lambda family phage portal protein [Maricaulis maris]